MHANIMRVQILSELVKLKYLQYGPVEKNSNGILFRRFSPGLILLF